MYKCPKCGSKEIEILVLATIFQNQDGLLEAEDDIDQKIDHNDSAYCAGYKCNWSGQVFELIKE